MRFITIICLIIISVSTLVLAQVGSVVSSLEPVAGSQDDWQFSFATTLSESSTNGLFVDLPDGLTLVPVMILLNDKPLYVLRTPSTPETDSIIAWQTTKDGLFLLSKEGQINAGDRLEFTGLAAVTAEEGTVFNITVKDVVRVSSELNIAEKVLASGTLPPLPRR